MKKLVALCFLISGIAVAGALFLAVRSQRQLDAARAEFARALADEKSLRNDAIGMGQLQYRVLLHAVRSVESSALPKPDAAELEDSRRHFGRDGGIK